MWRICSIMITHLVHARDRLARRGRWASSGVNSAVTAEAEASCLVKCARARVRSVYPVHRGWILSRPLLARRSDTVAAERDSSDVRSVRVISNPISGRFMAPRRRACYVLYVARRNVVPPAEKFLPCREMLDARYLSHVSSWYRSRELPWQL